MSKAATRSLVVVAVRNFIEALPLGLWVHRGVINACGVGLPNTSRPSFITYRSLLELFGVAVTILSPFNSSDFFEMSAILERTSLPGRQNFNLPSLFWFCNNRN